MPNLTTLTLSSGNITSSGTISTIDNSFGTAGTSNANVQTVQGISGGTNLNVNIAAGLNTNGATGAANSAPVTLPTDAAATTVAVTPIVTAASGYTSGAAVGGLMTFSSVGRTPGTSGVLQDVTITSKSIQTGEFDLYIFNANPASTTITDKSNPSINVADVTKVIGVAKMKNNYSGLGTHTVYKPDETTWAPIPFSASTLYGVLITPSAPSANFSTSTDITVTLGII